MSRTTGQPTVQGGLHVIPARSVAPVELPAPPEHLAARTAELLGWGGVMLPPMTLLGRRVVMVAELITDAHAERLALGCPPVTDRTTVSTWVWPELAGMVPAPAVRLVGAIALSRHWRTALTSVVPFSRFTNTAIVVPSAVAEGDDFLANCLMRAGHYGVSVATAPDEGAVELTLRGRPPQDFPVEQEVTVRWLREVVYDRILATTVS